MNLEKNIETSNGSSISERERLFNEFIREQRFIANFSERTSDFDRNDVFRRWKLFIGLEMTAKEKLLTIVFRMQEAGISIGTCNLSIRPFNSFLSWLQARGTVPADLRLKEHKKEQNVRPTFSNCQLKELPARELNVESRNEVRMFVPTRLLLDTGCRISESLSLKLTKIDFDNLLITVMGKGKNKGFRRSIKRCEKQFIYT